MNHSPIIVATTANDNYFHGLCVTVLSSIVSTSDEYPLIFHVLDSGIAHDNKRILTKLCAKLRDGVEIRFLPINANLFTGLSKDYGGGFSAYARLLIGSLIPESRLIYIDSDFLVLKDLSEAWSMDMAGNVILATKDIDTLDGMPNKLSADCPFAAADQVKGFDYYNSGFMVVDLDAWRETMVEKVAFSQIKGYESQLKAWDQTILNYVLRGRIGEIDRKWCHSCTLERVFDDQNIHYISGMKPWKAWSCIPAYRLWYLFHRTFVAPEFPLSLSLKTRFIGLARHLRNMLLIKFPILADSYIRSLEKRHGSVTSSLYSISINKSREALRDKNWRSSECLQLCAKLWLFIAARKSAP